MRCFSIVLLVVFLSISIGNIGVSANDAKPKKKSVKTKVKKKSKNKRDIKVSSIKVDGSSSITIGGTGTVNNNKSSKGRVIINDIVIPDHLLKGKTGNIKVKNDRLWIDGKEIDLTNMKPVKKLPTKKKRSAEDINKLKIQLRNFFGKNWEKHVSSKLRSNSWEPTSKSKWADWKDVRGDEKPRAY